MPDAMTILEIGFPPEIADYIQKNGADVVIRQLEGKTRGQILEHVSGVVMNQKDKLSEDTVKTLLDHLSKDFATGNQIVKSVRRAISQTSGNLKAVTSNLKSMSAEMNQIFKNVKSVQSLSYLSTGIGIANLAVDAVGFAIIAQKINGLSDQIEGISRQIEKIQKLQEGSMQEQYRIFRTQFNKFVQKVHDNDPVDFDEVYDLLGKMNAFINKIIEYYDNKAINPENILSMITVLLPMYTSLLNMYVTDYFEEKEKLPETFNSFLDVYQKLISNHFGQMTFDYYFLDEKYNRIDARDVANANILLSISCYTQISDQLEILKVMKTKENYRQYRSNLQKAADEEINNTAVEMADELNIPVERLQQMLRSKCSSATAH